MITFDPAHEVKIHTYKAGDLVLNRVKQLGMLYANPPAGGPTVSVFILSSIEEVRKDPTKTNTSTSASWNTADIVPYEGTVTIKNG